MGFETRSIGNETTMKVDPREQSNGKVTAITTESVRPPAEPKKASSPDTVRLSGEVRLADEAVRAAALSGDVRPEAVARARALLQSGSLGRDTEALADKIIDSLTETRGHRP
jgi:anti-sigma28 factor (negative regulator of flagellin synthesis)